MEEKGLETPKVDNYIDINENHSDFNGSIGTGSCLSIKHEKLLPLRSKSSSGCVNSIRMTKASKLQNESNKNKLTVYESFCSTMSKPQRPKTYAFGSYFEESSFWKTSRRVETPTRPRTKEGQLINKSTKRRSKRLNNTPLPSISKAVTPKFNSRKTSEIDSRMVKMTNSWWWRREKF